jgi:hypothetical protein
MQTPIPEHIERREHESKMALGFAGGLGAALLSAKVL